MCEVGRPWTSRQTSGQIRHISCASSKAEKGSKRITGCHASTNHVLLIFSASASVHCVALLLCQRSPKDRSSTPQLKCCRPPLPLGILVSALPPRPPSQRAR